MIYVGKGNNSSLIKTLFRNYRPWWTIEENPANSNVNLHWYQLRQNEILDNFKENPKSESDLLACEIYAEPEEKEPFKQTEFSKIEVGL